MDRKMDRRKLKKILSFWYEEIFSHFNKTIYYSNQNITVKRLYGEENQIYFNWAERKSSKRGREKHQKQCNCMYLWKKILYIGLNIIKEDHEIMVNVWWYEPLYPVINVLWYGPLYLMVNALWYGPLYPMVNVLWYEPFYPMVEVLW